MADIVAINRTVTVNTFRMQPVEIIIPFHNEHLRVINLVNDIFATVHDNRYLVTLVDDCSSNKEFVRQIEEKKMPGVRVISNNQQKGFGASVNNALRNPFRRDISWICILHSDIRLKDSNWLLNLGNCLNRFKEKGVKMVAPLTNNPVVDNSLLKAEGASQEEDVVLKEGFLPFYCVLAHRELFMRVGLLPEYPYAGGEAEDFALAMRVKGFGQAVCRSSWVQHEGRATISQFDKDKRAQQILRKVTEQRS